VAGLQPAFHINHLLEIRKSLQKKLKNSAATPERGAMTNAPSRDAVRHCFEHPEEECELYCETCGVLICWKCTMKGGEHHNHDYEELNKAFQKYKEEVTSSLEPIIWQLSQKHWHS